MHFDLCPNIHSVYFIIKTSFEFRPDHVERYHLCKPVAQGAFVRGALSHQVRLRTLGHGVQTVYPASGYLDGLFLPVPWIPL